MQSLREIGKQVEPAPDKQVSLTDPDARSMATSAIGRGNNCEWGKNPAAAATAGISPI